MISETAPYLLTLSHSRRLPLVLFSWCQMEMVAVKCWVFVLILMSFSVLMAKLYVFQLANENDKEQSLSNGGDPNPPPFHLSFIFISQMTFLPRNFIKIKYISNIPDISSNVSKYF